jgi:anti-sigma factor RsiW
LPPENSRRDPVTHEQAVETFASERYLLGEMSSAGREAFEAHFFSCEACAHEMQVGAAMLQGAKAGFAQSVARSRLAAPVPTSPASQPAWYRSAALPWAAAAALAVVTTYQSLWTVPSLRRNASPVVIVPVTLRPASRGADALVPLSSGGDWLTLAIEVNEPADNGQIAYTLTTADGRRVVSGRAAAPIPGTPLLLLIPATTLVDSTRYLLSITDAGPSHRSLGEYRFAVSGNNASSRAH